MVSGIWCKKRQQKGVTSKLMEPSYVECHIPPSSAMLLGSLCQNGRNAETFWHGHYQFCLNSQVLNSEPVAEGSTTCCDQGE
jgi:hypothetical protein